MKRFLALLLITVTVLALCACGENTVKLPEGQLLVGFGRVDLSPSSPNGISLIGYGGNGTPPTPMTGILDRTYGTCIAVTDGSGSTALIYTLDTLYTTKSEVDQIRKVVTEKTGISGENVVVSSIHTHSGMNYGDIAGYFDKMAQAAVDAIADQVPAKLYAGATAVKGMNFVRHYITKDGTVVGDNFANAATAINPRVKHATEADNQLQLIRFVREGEKKDIVLANWQAHPKVASTGENALGLAQRSMLSADFPGWCRTYVEEKADILFAYYTGAAGNLNAMSKLPEEQSGYSIKVNEYGAALGDYVLDAMEGLTEVAADKVSVKQQMLPVTPVTNDAASVMELTAIRLGDVGFAVVPFEMFDTNGMQIKADSDCATTFVLTCASMPKHEYIPAEYVWDYNTGSQTSYELSACMHERGTAEKVAGELANMLNSLTG